MVTLDNCVISQSSTVKNVGLTFDSALLFDQHINKIAKIVFYHLHNVAKITGLLLSTADAEILIHALGSLQCLIFPGLPRETP